MQNVRVMRCFIDYELNDDLLGFMGFGEWRM
jgi:hypothetical protein